MNSTLTSSPSYEVEIKSLLEGGRDQAMALENQLAQHFSDLQQVEDSQQLNHYFKGQALPNLVELVSPHLEAGAARQLAELARHTSDYSVRTRQVIDSQHPNPQVILVVKASIDDTSSQNGIARREFETTPTDLNLAQLDDIILQAGFEYQAKWSRARRAFNSPAQQLTVSIDKNAGYGYLAEFESLVTSPDATANAAQQLRSLMADLGVTELPQDRLERMFAHYNSHWQEYYGTEKTFLID